MSIDRVETGPVSLSPDPKDNLRPLSPPGGPAPDDLPPLDDDGLDTMPQDTPLFEDDLPSQ